jgi:hypothetical protein
MRPGSILEVPSGYYDEEGNVTNLFYVEDEGTDENRIEILAVGEGCVTARLRGMAVDVNYYDGSKPKTRVEVEATFRVDARLQRSFT